jgi:hypothetical protein
MDQPAASLNHLRVSDRRLSRGSSCAARATVLPTFLVLAGETPLDLCPAVSGVRFELPTEEKEVDGPDQADDRRGGERERGTAVVGEGTEG